MKTLNRTQRYGVGIGLCLTASLFWSSAARAEVTLIEQNGWTFSFDGRVNAFFSGGKGGDFPTPTANPNDPMATHTVLGGQSGLGVPDVGFQSNFQYDANNKFQSIRVRSGMYPNILGFGLQRAISDNTVIKAYVSLWATIETLGRDKWVPVYPEAREGYFTATGPWGALTAGRTLGWMGRTSWEIDSLYGHGYGVGMPCTDALGPACGHIGTGALFPGYSAGVYYETPELSGLQLHAGLYDPVVLAASQQQSASVDWSRAPIVRPEGSLTFVRDLGFLRLKAGVEGMYQPLGRNRTIPSATPGAPGTTVNESTSLWSVAGGLRVEAGPIRLGGSAFRNRGVGMLYAAQRTSVTEDNAQVGAKSFKLRTFTGFYGQVAAVIHRWQLSAGFGRSIVDQLAEDKVNPAISVLHTQTGISGGINYHVSDSLVLDLDYFHFIASWYGTPIVDNAGAATGAKLPGEKQTLDFLNLGATYHW